MFAVSYLKYSETVLNIVRLSLTDNETGVFTDSETGRRLQVQPDNSALMA